MLYLCNRKRGVKIVGNRLYLFAKQLIRKGARVVEEARLESE